MCLTDFGLSKEMVTTSNAAKTFCGTPEYLAPEILQNIGHGKAGTPAAPSTHDVPDACCAHWPCLRALAWHSRLVELGHPRLRNAHRLASILLTQHQPYVRDQILHVPRTSLVFWWMPSPPHRPWRHVAGMIRSCARSCAAHHTCRVTLPSSSNRSSYAHAPPSYLPWLTHLPRTSRG